MPRQAHNQPNQPVLNECNDFSIYDILSEIQFCTEYDQCEIDTHQHALAGISQCIVSRVQNTGQYAR